MENLTFDFIPDSCDLVLHTVVVFLPATHARCLLFLVIYGTLVTLVFVLHAKGTVAITYICWDIPFTSFLVCSSVTAPTPVTHGTHVTTFTTLCSVPLLFYLILIVRSHAFTVYLPTLPADVRSTVDFV